ncbi:hypothetical protein [Kribbella sp. NPDC051620]|uniref:hypothetical protein n=1 Tax=Kribbella sp. NPDC051620 TaxID=3364120 RepID=UPI0037891C59
MGTLCAISGLVLTVAGTLLAAMALIGDWRDHGGGEPLIPMIARARAWFRRHVLGRKPEVHSVSGQVTAHWGVTASATGYVSPPSNAPVDVQMRFVRERLIALESRIGTERQELDQKIGRLQEDAQATNARSQKAIDELEVKVRDVATGSVRLDLFGLVLVGVGSIVSALPAVFGWK